MIRRKRIKKDQRVGEWVSDSDSDNHSERSYHSDYKYTQDEGVAGLALVSTTPTTYLSHQMKELEDASWLKAQRYHTPSILI